MSKSDFIHKLVSMVMMDKKVLTFFFNIFVFGTLELILYIYLFIASLFSLVALKLF